MRLLALIITSLTLNLSPAVHHHHVHHRHHHRAVPHLTGPTIRGYATYYSPGECDPTGGGFTTAGGKHVYWGEVASDALPMHTHIWVWPAIRGKHEFTVEDTFGSGQRIEHIDVWLPCGETIGNPSISFRIVRR